MSEAFSGEKYFHDQSELMKAAYERRRMEALRLICLGGQNKEKGLAMNKKLRSALSADLRRTENCPEYLSDGEWRELVKDLWTIYKEAGVSPNV